MKNTFKLIGIIALAAIVIFSMTGCPTDGGSSSSGGGLGSVAKIELQLYPTGPEYAFGYSANYGMNPTTYKMWFNDSYIGGGVGPWVPGNMEGSGPFVLMLYRYGKNYVWNGSDTINISGAEATEQWVYTAGKDMDFFGIVDELSFIANFNKLKLATISPQHIIEVDPTDLDEYAISNFIRIK